MSEIAAELERARQAARGPALRLVTHKYSSLVLAVFRLSFGAQTGPVPAERLHAQVDAYLQELTQLGEPVPPNSDGRLLCLAWTHEQWLVRVATGEGTETYERTSHALAAERMVSAASRERAMLTESRLVTILDTARRWAAEAVPDRDARLTALHSRVAALQGEIERLEAGEEPVVADAERMRQGFDDLVDLLQELPGDFRRVQEDLEGIHRRMIEDFRAETRPRGEVLESYLRAAEHLMTRTEAGRAFQGALQILGDDTLLAEFRGHLRAIASHPFAGEVPAARRREFLDAAGVLRRGLYDVQTRQHRASRSLAEYLTQAQVGDEREISTVLRAAERALGEWMRTAGPNARVRLDSMPSRADLSHLRRRTDDLLAPTPPPALADVSEAAPPPPSLDDVIRHGGPLTAQVRSALEDAAAAGAGSLAEAFDSLPEHLRRPVELFGLAQLLTDQGLLPAQGETAASGSEEITPPADLTAIRPDGTHRRWRLPELPLPGHEQESQEQGTGEEQV